MRILIPFSKFSRGSIDKNFHHANRILVVTEVGGGGGGEGIGGWGGERWWCLSESVKKGKIRDKNHFSNNAEWSSKKLWKMISDDVKANAKQ